VIFYARVYMLSILTKHSEHKTSHVEEKPQEQKDVTFASLLACFVYCCKITRASNNRKWKTGRSESACVCFRFRQFFPEEQSANRAARCQHSSHETHLLALGTFSKESIY